MENLLSKDECKQIIKNFLKSDKFDIQRFQIFPIQDEYPGFCAEYCRLKIMFTDSNEYQVIRTFFMKMLPILNEQKRKMIEDYGIFQKEVMLYKDLIPNLKKYSENYKWCPECFYVRDDLLVFEDLTLQNYVTIPMKIDFTKNHLHKAIESLAVFHSTSIAYETFELKPAGTTINEKYGEMPLYETTFFPKAEWVECGSQALKAVALKKTKYGTKFKHQIESEFMTRIWKVSELVSNELNFKIPKVLCHRDLWKNNLMFQFADGASNKTDDDYSTPIHCVLLDFAISRCLPLTVDILSLIILCTRRSHHKQYFEYYLNFYYQRLKFELVARKIDIDKLFTWTEFRKNCNDFMLLPLLMNSLFITITCIPSEILIELNDKHPEKYNEIMMKNRTDFVFEVMEKNEWFRELLIESVEELLEFIFKIH